MKTTGYFITNSIVQIVRRQEQNIWTLRSTDIAVKYRENNDDGLKDDFRFQLGTLLSLV